MTEHPKPLHVCQYADCMAHISAGVLFDSGDGNYTRLCAEHLGQCEYARDDGVTEGEGI